MAVAGNEPLTVIPAQPPTGYAIPPPGPAQAVKLDMTAVKAKLAESVQICAILDDIFTEDQPESVPAPSVSAPSTGKVPAAHALLLSRLAERPAWSRAEFEAVAAEYKLLPDGAFEVINDAAFEHAGVPVLEGDDPIQVDVTTAEGLLA